MIIAPLSRFGLLSSAASLTETIRRQHPLACRKLSEELGVSKSTVQRILAQAKLPPHRLNRYMASNDPAFEAKASDIIGLYLRWWQGKVYKNTRSPLPVTRAEVQLFEIVRPIDESTPVDSRAAQKPSIIQTLLLKMSPRMAR